MRAKTLRVAAVCVLFLSVAPYAAGITNTLVLETYYSDPAFQNAVGWRFAHRCIGGGGPIYGEVGPYVIQEESSCIEPPIVNNAYKCFIYEWSSCDCSVGDAISDGAGCKCIENTWSHTCPSSL